MKRNNLPAETTESHNSRYETKSETNQGSERVPKSDFIEIKTSPGNDITPADETGPIVEVPTQSASIGERVPAAAAAPLPPQEGPTKEVSAPVASAAAESGTAKTAVNPVPSAQNRKPYSHR